MLFYRFIIRSLDRVEWQATELLQQAKLLGLDDIVAIECDDLYWIAGSLSLVAQERLLDSFLQNPILQIRQPEVSVVPPVYAVERVSHPNGRDPIADQIYRAVLKLGLTGIERIFLGKRFLIHTRKGLSSQALNNVVCRLLVNQIQDDYVLGPLNNIIPLSTMETGGVASVKMGTLTSAQLEQLSHERRTALNLREMQAIQAYFLSKQREPTDIELETLAQTWSEHCSHKTFRATIQYGDEVINGLLDCYIRAATEAIQSPWVVSAFDDNAGIISFDDEYQVAFKVETHNRPSAIDPFLGAQTGFGGVVRDILGVSAKPIAATDVFALGPQDLNPDQLPEGSLHPRVVQNGVVSGVQDYGNKLGIPTVNGCVFYDKAYVTNPLVFCGCIGLLPVGRHPRQPRIGDKVVVLGGGTGRDGLRGATFSSATLTANARDRAGEVVPTGDPMIARSLVEVVGWARDRQLYHAITDCGAGGLSSAIGEMSSAIGAEIELSHVPLKYPGLSAWEIWLSESQERMILAVPAQNIPLMQERCYYYNLNVADLGVFTGQGTLLVRYKGKQVLELNNHFLYQGRPSSNFSVEKWVPNGQQAPIMNSRTQTKLPKQYEHYLLCLLRYPTIASKEEIIRLYDYEVQSATVIKPLMGAQGDGPSDACVLKPQGTSGSRGLVLSNGFNPELGKYNPYRMAVSVIDEAVRNAVAVGADPDRLALLDNFCWGDPHRPEVLAALVECAKGCYASALHFSAPFISGKDSLNNEYHERAGGQQAIPGTLLISAVAIIEDVGRAVSLDFKFPGNLIYLIGKTQAHLGGSHLNLCTGLTFGLDVPDLPPLAPLLYRCLHRAICEGLIRACHDLSEGGLAVALAEMCLAGRMGCRVAISAEDPLTYLFSESNGRLLLEVEPGCQRQFEVLFEEKNLKQWLTLLGRVEEQPRLQIVQTGDNLIALSVDQLVSAWKKDRYA